MKACTQAEGLTIYEHGLSVANHYRDLYAHLSGSSPCYQWEIPPEAVEKLKALLPKALTPKDARTYHIFHDCGKPSTAILTETGQRRFPGHVEASAMLFRQACPEDELTARLIERDMLCHTLKPAEAQELINSPEFPTLMLTAWAELHANASSLFGGFQADSFKIKRKHLWRLLKLTS